MKKFKFVIDGHKYEVSVNEIENNVAELEVNGTPFTVEIEKEEKVTTRPVAKPAAATSAPAAAPATGSVKFIASPLPGSIVRVLVEAGQSVKKGDVLLTMESMKMENNISAEADGVVKSILVTPGQNVMQDDKLIEFAVATAAQPAAPAPKPQPAPQPQPAAPAPKPQPAPAAPAGGYKVMSPLPGSVVKVAVAVGADVKKGDVLLTLESMKMENNILAEKDGKVTAIMVSAGQSVMQDDVLVVLG
ncbi:MAG: biotin/lipoyl-containing protein [Paludibacteraceae bacterium]|nr:biotin/lipoyl-containing protein [Paludibacteraceae bacterium]